MKKSIRYTNDIVSAVLEVRSLNPLIDKNSRVFSYAYELVAKEIKSKPNEIDWKNISKTRFNNLQNSTENLPGTTTISINDNNFKTVKSHSQKQSGIKKVQFPYLTKLCLLFTINKLRSTEILKKNNISEENNDKTDSVSIIGTLDAIISLYKQNDSHSMAKLNKIKHILLKEDIKNDVE